MIRGVLQTRRRNLITTVRYTGKFRNHQAFEHPGAKQYDETIMQDSTVSMTVDRKLDGRLENSFVFTQQDPLSITVHKTMVTTGQDFIARVAVRQGHEIVPRRTDAAGEVYRAHLAENLNARERACGKSISPPLNRSDFDHKESG